MKVSYFHKGIFEMNKVSLWQAYDRVTGQCMFGMHCPFLCHSFKSQDAVRACMVRCLVLKSGKYEKQRFRQ